MLAIIAGQGRLPGLIAGAQPAPPLICALAGFEPEGIAPDLVFRLETLGTLLQQLQARGAEIVAALSAADVGQGCVVLKRQALAIESAYGTDWMLASLTARPDTAGGVLVKMPKDGQDRRVDLPTIGVTTVEAAAQARLDGITIEAGGVLVLDRDAVRAACDRLGLFLWVREAAG